MSEILLHIGTGSSVHVNMALTVLDNLAENHLVMLVEHTVCIMSLLIKLPDLEPMQVRQLVDIIGTLIFSNPTDDVLGLQDELQIFIRKQLSSFKLEQHNKGVVASVMYVKHAAGVDAEENQSSEESVDLDKRLTEANSLLGNLNYLRS